jgi:hypothetical protein
MVSEASSDGELKVALAAQRLGVSRTRGLKQSSRFRNYIHSEPRFRALLTKRSAKVLFHSDASDRIGGVLA